MYQKEWDWFLLDFGIQEWDTMNKTKKSFLKKLKIQSVEAIREKQNDVIRDEIKIVICYKNIEHTIELTSSNMEGYDYITFDFDDMDKIFGIKLRDEDKKKIERHFIDFFTRYLKDKIDYTFVNKDKVKELKEEIKAKSEEGIKVDEKVTELLQEIIKEWYEDGFASWKHRDAPGEDGIFGGSFHYLGELEPLNDGFVFVIDFGSAEEKDALYDLAHRLKDIGFEVDSGDYSNEIIIQPKKEELKKIDIHNWIGNVALANKLKSGDKIQISLDGEDICIVEMNENNSRDIVFKKIK